jgi:BASS family bile acid:Na+ symporter
MTPFLMKTLAGEFIEVNFLGMMFSILNMIIVPLAAGLIAHYILYSKHKISLNSIILIVIVLIAIAGSVILINYTPDSLLTVGNTELQQVTPVRGLLHIEVIKDMWVNLSKDGFVVGFVLIGIVAFAQLIVRIMLKGPEHWMGKVLPLVSMVGICFIIAIITARSAEELKKIGLLLIFAGILHNAIGYVLGYWGARAARLSENDCRTVAIEVGLQNGGMASGLAMTVSDIATDNAKVALAPAIFGPWMNISGSVLATWWRSKPVGRPKTKMKDDKEPTK